MMLYHGDTFTHNGRAFCVSIEPDSDSGAPWDNEDGHGPVTGWERRAKLPGELVLNGDGRGGLGTDRARRFYDFQAACRIARREGWGFLPYPLTYGTDETGKGWAQCSGPGFQHRATGETANDAIAALYAAHRATMTARQYAAGAARADYERLRGWCNDSWSYVGVVVTAGCECCEEYTGESLSLWGIESDSFEYLDEVARELADEIQPENEGDSSDGI